jgi:hypothetical protein
VDEHLITKAQALVFPMLSEILESCDYDLETKLGMLYRHSQSLMIEVTSISMD